jgi:hypothetical protein
LRRGIGQEVASLIVACKDYAERYGRQQGESYMPLPHIGWGQRLAGFTFTTGREHFGFSTRDSIGIYQQLLHYFVRSCSDLIEVRSHVQRLLRLIAATEPSLQTRAEHIESSVEEGTRRLEEMRQKLERTATVIGDVLTYAVGFDERRATLRQRASSEAPDVSRLLLAVAQVRSAEAWSIPSPETTLTAAVFVNGYRLCVSFADGLSGELELGEEFWQGFYGISMDLEAFRLFHLDIENNAIVWSRQQHLSGEGARLLVAHQTRTRKASGTEKPVKRRYGWF